LLKLKYVKEELRKCDFAQNDLVAYGTSTIPFKKHSLYDVGLITLILALAIPGAVMLRILATALSEITGEVVACIIIVSAVFFILMMMMAITEHICKDKEKNVNLTFDEGIFTMITTKSSGRTSKRHVDEIYFTLEDEKIVMVPFVDYELMTSNAVRISRQHVREVRLKKLIGGGRFTIIFNNGKKVMYNIWNPIDNMSEIIRIFNLGPTEDQ
jgi:hypothetical protein